MHCSNATFLIISLLILSPLNISLSLGHQIGMVKPLKHTGQNIGVFWIAIVISEYTSCFRLFFFLKSSLKLCKFCRMDHCWYQFPFLFFVGVHILFFFVNQEKLLPTSQKYASYLFSNEVSAHFSVDVHTNVYTLHWFVLCHSSFLIVDLHVFLLFYFEPSTWPNFTY